MEQKIKFIIIGLIGFSVICLFFVVQVTSQQQALVREGNDLKSENATLLSKVSQLENDLRANQGKIESLKAERDKSVATLSDLEKKYASAAKARDELIDKLKSQSQRQPEMAVALAPVVASPEKNDAYWGQILKAKTDLEMQLASMQVDLKGLQISNESLQRQKSVLEMDVNSLHNEKKDLLRQLDYNQKLLDSISQDVVREKNDKIGIQDTLKTLKNENEIFSQQLKSLSSRKIILDEKIQSLQEGKAAVEKRLSQMDTMLNDRASQIDSLKSELDAFKSGKPLALTAEKRESVELPAIVVRSSLPSANAQGAAFSGKILAINADNNFVVIDLGSSSAVKVGDLFNVWRAGQQIGTIVVIQTRDNISACDIKKINVPLKIGDDIK